MARAHESVHERLYHDSYHAHGHTRRHSQARKGSTESHTRAHSRTRSRTRSLSPQRATSPLRTIFDRFPALGRVHSREEPFIPVNPFQLRERVSFGAFARCCGARPRTADVEAAAAGSQVDLSCQACACVPLCGSARFHSAHILALDTLPRQLYLHSQMRLPSLYFSRVARIFEDAAVSRPEMQRIIDACEDMETSHVQHRAAGRALPFPEEWAPPNVSPSLARFKRSWEGFVDSLVREWKTLNVVSALLLSAILTIFQIPDAADDPLTRTAALLSLVSALMSLCYGIVYIVRFGTMRSMYRASRWAEEAQKTETAIFWNVWVLLALPGVWLAWSVLAFVVAILAFVWRTGAQGDAPAPLAPRAALGPRVAITAEFALGLVYFALVVRTLSSYGESGRRARVVRRIADGQVEMEARRERERGRGREQGAGRERGRSREREREGEGEGRREDKEGNGLGLSGVERKRDVVVVEREVPPSDSFSSLGL
ncbi:hypothetical protein BC834DRAFT_831003 [Gloeopeniophorella convolvens]|nr:hypothetical protein BC834DRAFT_831003 [Gloeopeniophorella convolvens]